MLVRCRSYILAVFFLAAFCVVSEARVTAISLQGDVKVIKQGSSMGRKCSLGATLNPGDWISVGGSSYVLLSFDMKNQNTVHLDSNTIAMISEPAAPERVEIFDGELIARLEGLSKGESFKIRTPTATCGARGTAWHIATDGRATDINVLEHEVFVLPLNPDGSEKDAEYSISEGFARTVHKDALPSDLRKIGKDRFGELNKTIPALLESISGEAAPSHHRTSSRAVEEDSFATRSGIVMVDGVGVSRDMYEQINAWRDDARSRAEEIADSSAD